MPSLLLDTSTERGIVAVVQDEKILFFKELPFGFQNSKWLLPAIEEGLKLTGLAAGELEWVAVGVGPGSYTGIRVGASAAKALAFAWHIPLVGVCTLDGFVPEEDAVFAAAIDAKIGGVYIQKGLVKDGRVSFTSKPALCPLAQAIEILSDIEVIVTPYAAAFRPKLEAFSSRLNWKWQERYPSVAQLAKTAKEKFRRHDFSTDGHLDLLYLRKTQAEIEKAT